MGGDEKLAAQNVVVSSALCLLTLFGWIWALSALGLI
jgi:predicted permease